jgi:hypothetical protein
MIWMTTRMKLNFQNKLGQKGKVACQDEIEPYHIAELMFMRSTTWILKSMDKIEFHEWKWQYILK